MKTISNSEIKAPKDRYWKRDFVKFSFMLAAILAVAGVFFLNPTLSTPTIIAGLTSMVLAPVITSLERRGYPRSWSIVGLFAVIGFGITLLGIQSTHSAVEEWTTFQKNVPRIFDRTVETVSRYEAKLEQDFGIIGEVKPSDSIVRWGHDTGTWFIVNGPALMGEILTYIFIIPLFSFFFLLDGRRFKRKFYQLVPNRMFESTVVVTSKIIDSLSDYIRAKILEATLVGLMTGVGLALIDAPYAIVLGVIAGVANILPYIGPLVGAVPGILIALFDPSAKPLLLKISMVYLIANVIDIVFIFPILVAKLVNLHPVVLLVAVILGQQYYGLIGMLISIPIATALKVILQEIYSMIYEPPQFIEQAHLQGEIQRHVVLT